MAGSCGGTSIIRRVEEVKQNIEPFGCWDQIRPERPRMGIAVVALIVEKRGNTRWVKEAMSVEGERQ